MPNSGVPMIRFMAALWAGSSLGVFFAVFAGHLLFAFSDTLMPGAIVSCFVGLGFCIVFFEMERQTGKELSLFIRNHPGDRRWVSWGFFTGLIDVSLVFVVFSTVSGLVEKIPALTGQSDGIAIIVGILSVVVFSEISVMLLRKKLARS